MESYIVLCSSVSYSLGNFGLYEYASSAIDEGRSMLIFPPVVATAQTEIAVSFFLRKSNPGLTKNPQSHFDRLDLQRFAGFSMISIIVLI